MAKYRHMPTHPYANERGVVEINEKFYEGLYLMGSLGEDKRMMRGNEPVVINYISDHMPETKHMALDIWDAPIDSKSKFRKITKEKGCVEIGNETSYLTKPRKPIKLDRKVRRDHIKQALQNLRSGQVPRDGNGRLKTEIL
mgnify:CR=1 FL=1